MLLCQGNSVIGFLSPNVKKKIVYALTGTVTYSVRGGRKGLLFYKDYGLFLLGQYTHFYCCCCCCRAENTGLLKESRPCEKQEERPCER